jgi:uncharacterized protein (TIGR00251 family)
VADHRLSAVADNPSFLRRTSSGVTIELRVQPRSRRAALACSGGALKAAVTAPAEDGKANSALIDLLAEEWRLPKSVLEIMRGASQRDKVVRISGEPNRLAERIVAWMSEQTSAGGRGSDG